MGGEGIKSLAVDDLMSQQLIRKKAGRPGRGRKRSEGNSPPMVLYSIGKYRNMAGRSGLNVGTAKFASTI
jgi:hypothetical protein